MTRDRADDGRPSPDALLAAVAREARGRFKIFLGAAPGVGKTYEMLLEARRKKAEGVDVVVGVVETHGRRETETLLRSLEVVPRQQIDYKGRVLAELDLDAVLKRAPALALIDELAHTNVPGARHAKRYLDVEELLAAGIDVYSTMNVQHLESLNDVVAQITRIRVRETVPDSILDRADAVEVVDITPEELIRRLEEGKVYVPEQAQRALGHYFSPGNLTALRELVLRRTAERVDEQMVDYMRSHAISGPWPAGGRVLACIDASARAGDVVRQAKRQADRLRAPWTALYVATPRHEDLKDEDRDRIGGTLRLAVRLGGEALTLPGELVADEILSYARQHNVTQIVVGHSKRPWWSRLVTRPVVPELIARSNGITIQVVTGDGTATPPAAVQTARTKKAQSPKAYVMTTAMVTAALGVCQTINEIAKVPDISLVFIAAILVSAMQYGLLPSIYASLLSVLAYNFFLIDPTHTMRVTDPANFLALFFFLFVAVLTSGIMARTRSHSLAARARAKVSAELYAFSRKLAAIGQLDDLLWATVHQVASMLRVEVVLLIAEHGQLHVRAGFPPEDQIDDADHAAARWCWDNNRPAGWGAETLPGARRLFLPLRTGRGSVGVIGIMREARGTQLSPDERRLLDALVDQAALAIERTLLAERADEARLEAEAERLRGALLSSVSAELSSPLQVVRSTLADLQAALTDPASASLVALADVELVRLDRSVANLLHMTRLDGGALAVDRIEVDVDDVIGGAMQRAAGVLANHQVAATLPPDLPKLSVDLALMEHVLANLLDNAAKYSPPGSRIEIGARLAGDRIVIQVRDEGPGVPEDEIGRIFGRFHRAPQARAHASGSGLGLTVCRGLVEAHGGEITVANREDRSGAVFAIALAVDRDAGRPPQAASASEVAQRREAAEDEHDEGGRHPGQILLDEDANPLSEQPEQRRHQKEPR